MAKVEEHMLINFSSEITKLLKGKLIFFLNSRAKSVNFDFFSFKEDENDKTLYLNLKINNYEYDLIRWTEGYSSLNESRKRMESLGYSIQDIDIIEIVLSRLGYIFRVETEKKTNRDLKILFFILQMNTLNHCNETTDEIRTELFQSFLCELFLHYETFSRFKYVNSKLLFLSDSLGDKVFFDVISDFYNNENEKSNDFYFKSFHLEMIKCISSKEFNLSRGIKKEFNDPFVNYINPMDFVNLINKDENYFFSMLNYVINPLQSTQELFISNLLLINYAFFILKKDIVNILRLKNYINDNNHFCVILKLIIDRSIMLPKSKFINVGLADFITEISNNEYEQSNNVLTELVTHKPLLE